LAVAPARRRGRRARRAGVSGERRLLLYRDAVGPSDRDHLVGVEHVALDEGVGDRRDGRTVLAHQRLRALGLHLDEGTHRRVDLPGERAAGLPGGRAGVGADEAHLVAHAVVGHHARATPWPAPGRRRRRT
jgi:hypothetical protein